MKCRQTEVEIETIVTRMGRNEINLQPDFQRGEVWSTKKKQKLIDSILRGWKIPPIHLIINNDNISDVLDGQQRLASIRDFCNNVFAVDGNIQPYSEEINKIAGCKFKDLPVKYQLDFNRYSITFIYIEGFNPEEPAELFDRLNQPMKLTSSEQRNAYMGSARSQVKKLVDIFEKRGANIDTIGFSNSRLRYDDLISKFCYILNKKTLSEKIKSNDIIEIYRKKQVLMKEL